MVPKPKFQRMSKEERRNLKLWADGARETILLPHIEPYADSLDRGWTTERLYLEKVYNEYHSRISWRLLDHEEPPLPLPPYDPLAIAVPEILTDEERLAKIDRIKTVNARIRRWLKYRVKRIRRFYSSRMDPRKDPYAVLLGKLSGLKAPPKARQAYQQFMHEQYHERIDSFVKKAWQEKVQESHLKPDSTPNAAFRAKIAREVFLKLPKEEQEVWAKKAKQEAAKAKAAYEDGLKDGPPQTPEQVQRAIDNIPAFLGRVIQGIQEKTKLKFVVMYGGPFPSNGGAISTNHVNYGTNLSAEPQYFFQWKRDHFEKQIMGHFKEWLSTCYTKEQIQASSMNLPDLSQARYQFDDNSDHSDVEPAAPELPPNSSDDSDLNSSEEEDEVPRKKAASKKAARKSPKNPPPKPPYQRSQDFMSLELREALRSHIPQFTPPTPAGGLTPTADITMDPGDSGLSPGPTLPASSPPTQETQPVAATQYCPYDAVNPDGPLVAPDYTNYEQVKAYNVARNKRTLADIDDQLRENTPPAKKRRVNPRNQPASPRVVQPVVTAPTLPPAAATPSAPSQNDTSPAASGESSPMDIDPPELPSTHSPSSPILPPSQAHSAGDSPGDDPRERNGASSPSTNSDPGSTTSLPSPTSNDPLPKCPKSAPAWMHEALNSISKVPLGSEFNDILRSFIAIEAAHSYENPNRGLPAAGRPELLSKWVQGGRWRGKEPKVLNPDDFGLTWWNWWVAMQPSWRQIKRKRPIRTSTYGDDWSALLHPGQNGVLSVIATLYWWGLAVNGTGVPGPAHDSWSAAVSDVNWTLQGLMEYLDKQNE